MPELITPKLSDDDINAIAAKVGNEITESILTRMNSADADLNRDEKLLNILKALQPKQKEAVELSDSLPINKNGITEPNDDQLAKMNALRPTGTEPYTKDEVQSVELLASHNLLSLDLKAWSPRVLQLFSEDYFGEPYMLDHDWFDSDRTIGFVYDTEIRKSKTAPPEEYEYNGYGDVNKMIIDTDGYIQLILFCCIEKNAQLQANFRFKRYCATSTGAFVWPMYICPICQIEFKEEECPHLPPSWYVMYLKRNGWLTPEEVALIAPYIIRDSEHVHTVEISQVYAGNLITTRVL